MLDKGALVEHGPPDDLSSKDGGVFAALVAATSAMEHRDKEA